MANELARKTQEESIEADILSGNAVARNNEVSFNQNVKRNNHNFIYPLYQRKINLFEYEFLKTYLYAIYEGTLTEVDVLVTEFASLGSIANPVIIAPKIESTNEIGLSVLENDIVYVHLEFEGCKYQITVFLQYFSKSGNPMIRHFISVLGIGPDSTKTTHLADYLMKQSVRISYYKNNLLSVRLDDGNIEISILKIDEFRNELLDEIYVPEKVKSELVRFEQCARSFTDIGYGLRYLLCGEPGTGKTKSVRALINSLYGKVTILIASGETDFKSLFDFARLLSPAVICLDDLDLITSDREHSYNTFSLGSFLQELDGFEKNNIFLLATTNDKSLIDKAASRPGRFDMILDFSKIHNSDYANLINSATKDELIINLFDEELLDTLKRKNITGAFIVNLIKQLEIKYKLEPGCDMRNYLNDLIDLSYRGFYKKPGERELGFKMNGE